MLRLARGSQRPDHHDFSGDECSFERNNLRNCAAGTVRVVSDLPQERIDAPRSVSFASLHRKHSFADGHRTSRLSRPDVLYCFASTGRAESCPGIFDSQRHCARARNHRKEFLGGWNYTDFNTERTENTEKEEKRIPAANRNCYATILMFLFSPL